MKNSLLEFAKLVSQKISSGAPFWLHFFCAVIYQSNIEAGSRIWEIYKGNVYVWVLTGFPHKGVSTKDGSGVT